ncbi:MAG: flagellar motor switch protein FliM [Gammaproteobacteria bacterium]
MSNSDLLSQDEIDALLSGVDSGEVETGADASSEDPGARAYDFASQDRIVRGRMPTLEMVNERFARNFRISLFNFLRRSPSISVDGVQMSKFAEYIHTLFVPSNLNLIKMKPLRGTALCVLSPKLVFSVVDCFFGGDGRFHAKIEGRDFTATEMRVVHQIIDRIFAGLHEAWAPVFPLEFEYVGSEVNPQFANIVSPSEVIVVSTFHIELDNGGGDMQLAIPYLMLEPMRELLDAGVQSDVTERDERWATSLREEMKSAPVLLTSTLTRAEITLRDVLAMEPGQIIPIEVPQSVAACVESVPVFKAKYGVSRGAMALQVLEMARGAQSAPALA